MWIITQIVFKEVSNCQIVMIQHSFHHVILFSIDLEITGYWVNDNKLLRPVAGKGSFLLKA